MAELARENYDSGSDFLLEYGDLKFTYSETDFGERAELAANTLAIVDGRLEEGEVQDLICLIVEGRIPIEKPASALGKHINNSQELIKSATVSDGGLVHWLRRLVFRGSWLDQRVSEGELRFRFIPDDGSFDYVQAAADPETAEPIELPSPPTWRHVTYDPNS